MFAMLFVCAEARADTNINFADLTNTKVYYANSSHTQSDWADLPLDNVKEKSFSHANKVKKNYNTVYKKEAIQKKAKNNTNCETWTFPEINSKNTEKWENATKPSEMMAGAVPSASNKTQYGNAEVAYANTTTQIKQNESLKSKDIIMDIGDNLRIKRKRETRAFTLNNIRESQADQKVYLTKTEVYGAHAELSFNDDFSIGVGPEYSHSTTKSAAQGDTTSDTDLSLGFQLMLEF